MTPAYLRPSGLSAAALVLLAACAPPASDPSAAMPAGAQPPGLEHVHAVEADPATGTVYAATHSGVWRLPHSDDTVPGARPAAELVGTSTQDTMGLTVAPDGTLYASGHPAPGERPELARPNLGLIRSTDGGLTWQQVSLGGEVDFHALAVAPLDDDRVRITGLDSGTSRLLISDDSGATWSQGASIAAHDLVMTPREPQVVIATTPDGPQISRDAGRTFSAVPAAPLLVTVDVTIDGVVGIDVDGQVWTGSQSLGDWSRHGQVPDAPQAMTYVPAELSDGGPLLLIATATTVLTTSDLGKTWDDVLEPTA